MSQHKKITVLLVEDDDVDAEVVRRSFSKNNITAELQRAGSGVEALEMLRGRGSVAAEDACIVLLDLNMPGVNGHEFLTQLREDELLSKTPVFVLTTSDHASDVKRAYDKNVAGYFTKSHLNDLIVVLNSYIEGARLP